MKTIAGIKPELDIVKCLEDIDTGKTHAYSLRHKVIGIHDAEVPPPNGNNLYMRQYAAHAVVGITYRATPEKRLEARAAALRSLMANLYGDTLALIYQAELAVTSGGNDEEILRPLAQIREHLLSAG